MKWFSSLTRAAETKMGAETEVEDEQISLQHSVQLYSVFVETGDERYLDLCEDFLQHSLDAEHATKR